MKELIKLLTEYQKEDAYIFTFFRLYIGGCYNNENGSKRIRENIKEQCHNIALGKKLKSSDKKLKSQCISAFLRCLGIEFDLPRHQVRKAIFIAFDYSKETPEKLNDFNDSLVAEAVHYCGYSEII